MKGIKLLDNLEPDFKEECSKILTNLEKVTGVEWCITQGTRTIAEQDALYAKGRTTQGDKVTNAKGGQSPHNFNQAIDVCPINPKDGSLWWNAPEKYWVALGQMVEGLGDVWGGHFKSILDKPHIEDNDWKDTQTAWKEGKVKIS